MKGQQGPPAPVQRAGPSWPSRLLELALLLKFLFPQREVSAGKEGPSRSPFQGGSTSVPLTALPVAHGSHTILCRTEMWAVSGLGQEDRSGSTEGPGVETRGVLPQSHPGP